MAYILVVEDIIDTNHLLTEILSDEGHDIKQAFNGDEAIKILHDKNAQGKDFDLVITDMIMPVQDGFDLISFMKNKNIKTPVLVISGGGVTISSEKVLDMIRKDVAEVMIKPVDRAKLLKAVKKLTSS